MAEHHSNWITTDDGKVVESDLRIYPSSDGSTVDIELANYKAGMVLCSDRELGCAVLDRFTNEKTCVRMMNLIMPGDALVSANNRSLLDEDFEDIVAYLGMLQISEQPRRLRFLNTRRCSIANYRQRLALNEVTKDKYGFSRTVEYLLAEKSEHVKEQESIRQARDLEFVNYLKAIGGVENLKPAGVFKPSYELKQIIRRGVPIAFRPTVWMKVSLASQHKRAFPEDYYASLLGRVDEELDAGVADDIEKDIDRTFPEHDYFQDVQGEGVCALRRLLQAYALHNEEVGYCQALNFLAGTMLLYLSEEDAFWLFVTVVDTLLPGDYFSHSMVGMYVDQMVLSHMIQLYMPKIHENLEKEQLQLPLVTVQWFMCCFVTTLRHDVALRVWDVFLNEGSKVIFRIACALFKMNEQKILKTKDGGDLFMTLRNLGADVIDADSLLGTAYKDFHSLNKKGIYAGNGSVFIGSPRMRTGSGSHSFVPSPLEGIGLAHVGPSRNHTPSPAADWPQNGGSDPPHIGPRLKRSKSTNDAGRKRISILAKLGLSKSKTPTAQTSGTYFPEDSQQSEFDQRETDASASLTSPASTSPATDTSASSEQDEENSSTSAKGTPAPHQDEIFQIQMKRSSPSPGLMIDCAAASPAIQLRKLVSVQAGLPRRPSVDVDISSRDSPSTILETISIKDERSRSSNTGSSNDVGSGEKSESDSNDGGNGSSNDNPDDISMGIVSMQSGNVDESPAELTLKADQGRRRTADHSSDQNSNGGEVLVSRVSKDFRTFKRGDIEAWRAKFKPEMQAKFNKMQEARREWQEQEKEKQQARDSQASEDAERESGGVADSEVMGDDETEDAQRTLNLDDEVDDIIAEENEKPNEDKTETTTIVLPEVISQDTVIDSGTGSSNANENKSHEEYETTHEFSCCSSSSSSDDGSDEENSNDDEGDADDAGTCHLSSGHNSIYMFSSDEESETDTDEDDIIDAAFMDVLRQKRTSSRGAGKPAPRDEGVDKDNQGSGSYHGPSADVRSTTSPRGGSTPRNRSGSSGSSSSRRRSLSNRSPVAHPTDLIPDRVDFAESEGGVQLWQWLLGSNKGEVHEVEI